MSAEHIIEELTGRMREVRAERDAAVARAVTAETDLASACSETVRWGERATTAEAALAAARAENSRLREGLKLATRHNPQPTAQDIKRARALLDVPDQPTPTDTTVTPLRTPLLTALYIATDQPNPTGEPTDG